MLLKSLKLKNIRSYNDETIAFPKGIVLLAGDIGSGKSTILLAIEFALFGILRGELPGSALLRNGAKEGVVELTFELNSKEYTIGRTLKRSKTSVEQSTGYIIENGLRREATAIELKSTILNLLGYPPELVTKSKNMIYRYTVYTPQEDMKKIILEDAENRLMILRKVFDIDKYKRICDNASTYAKSLRERKRIFEGQLVDEAVKKQQLKEKKLEADKIQKTSLDIQPRLQEAKQAVLQQKEEINKLEAERKALNQHSIALKAAETEILALGKHRNLLQTDLAQLTPMLSKEIPVLDSSPEEIAKSLQQKNKDLQANDKELQTHIMAHAELKANKKISEDTAAKIISLDNCPMCLQKVNDSHKHEIAEKEKQKAESVSEQLSSYETSVNGKTQNKTKIQNEIQDLQQKQASVREIQLKIQQHKLDQERKKQIDAGLADISAKLTEAEKRKQESSVHVQTVSALETRSTAEKGRLDAVLQQEQHVVVEHATLLERAKLLKETLSLLEKELEVKKQAREKLEKLNVLHQWVNEFFTNSMQVIEKHVMTKIYHDFNELFVQWFQLLIQDEVLMARLNEEFTPVVQQNGYDTELSNLSGGEKTACALAYRLALNKVITALHSSVHTKDLLILDEPTDGFSADQIDHMREVLEQLRARQIILVSHEAKIESLADNVIRIMKQEHSSKIIV